jgi:hypothetical protein
MGTTLTSRVSLLAKAPEKYNIETEVITPIAYNSPAKGKLGNILSLALTYHLEKCVKAIVLCGETGLLFQVGDVKELANAIVYVLTHSKEAKRMGCKARRLVEEKFSIKGSL